MNDELPAARALLERLFSAVERRDLRALLECYDRDVQISEPDSLPYGGTYRGHEGAIRHARAYIETWGEYQGADEARLEPLIAVGERGLVTATFRHRARDPRSGEALDMPEVALYEIANEKVVRSQMFHADPVALLGFLDRAKSPRI